MTVTKYEGNLVIISEQDSIKCAGLKEVTGNLSLHGSAKLDALKSVGGYLSLYGSAKLDAPKLESVGYDLSLYDKAKLIAPKLYADGYSKFKVYNGIGCVVISTKQRGDATVLSCRVSKIKNQKIVGDKFYIAQQNGQNAHAKTSEEALRQIHLKLVSAMPQRRANDSKN